jgi:ParB/RepB/Spo0J family partition protein
LQREDFIAFVSVADVIFSKMEEEAAIEEIAVSGIGEKYGIYRIVNPRADTAMVKSIQMYGQISPVVCVKGGSGYELIDGFKRVRACRRLNKPVLRAKTMEVSVRACKAAIVQLNRAGGSITEIEEAMVLQSLHREDGLMQIEIATLVGRNKSWVSRRLSLIERLSEEIQDDIRLGLLSVSVGRELAKLPRGNQRAAAEAVLKHRFSMREVEKLITHLLSRPRWEHQTLLMSPWEIIEPKQSKPVGFQAQLISMHGICKSVSEGFKKISPEKRRELSEFISRAVGAAQEVVQILGGGTDEIHTRS